MKDPGQVSRSESQSCEMWLAPKTQMKMDQSGICRALGEAVNTCPEDHYSKDHVEGMGWSEGSRQGVLKIF